MLTSLAIALDEDYDRLLKLAEHDGSEKLWPSMPEPFCYRGHSVQDLVKIAYSLAWSGTMFDVQQYIGSTQDNAVDLGVDHAAIKLIEPDVRCVLLTHNHALATDGVQIFDPKGFVYNYEPYWVESKCQAFILFDANISILGFSF